MRRMRRIRGHQAIPEPSPELTWDVEINAVYSKQEAIPGYKAIHRNDTNEVLSINKNSYQEITNEELKSITYQMAEFTGFKVKGFSEIHRGKKIIAYLQNEEDITIAGFDAHKYMILGNSFDRSSGFFLGESSLLLRCTNQWGSIGIRQNIRHKKGALIKIEKMVSMYNGFIENEKKKKVMYENWHGIEIPQELEELFIDRVLEIDSNKVSTRKINQRKDLATSVNTEIAAMGNTGFGLFNGVTHYTTHVCNSNSKVFGNLFGTPALINERAEQTINELIEEYNLV
jgi:hypothetical protein